MIPVSKGEEYIIKIDGMSASGGVGRAGGFAVFVPRTAVGDTVRVRITRVKRSFAQGEAVEIIKPSPDRTEEDCPHAAYCGGCRFRHVSYDAQLGYKRDMVENALRRIGGFADFSLDEVIGAQSTRFYRNKAVFRAGSDERGRAVCGFFEPRSHKVHPADGCLICGAGFTEIAAAVEEYMNEYGVLPYDERTGRGTVKSVFVRSSRKTGAVSVVISANGTPPRARELVNRILSASDKITGVALEGGGRVRAVYGAPEIEEEIRGINFLVSPESFLQVNPEQMEWLYAKALEFADADGGEIMDIYCGIGTMTLAAAKTAKIASGIEAVERAVFDARRNAKLNGIENAEFYCGRAADIVPELIKAGARPGAVILDPPRAGSDEKTLAAICAAAPERVVYVSCDSASLARDLRFMRENGYKIARSAAVDMFPYTAHVETVCLLSKLNVKQHIEVELTMDEMDLTAAEKKASYEEIKVYVLEKFGMKVSHLYIAQVKRKCGIIERENYNKPKSEDSKQPQCPPEKESAIRAALEYFKMI